MEIIYFILIAIAIFVLVKIITAPIRLLFKILLNAALGLIILFIFNTIGMNIGLVLDINLITCLISGVFGIPGVVVLVILKLLF